MPMRTSRACRTMGLLSPIFWHAFSTKSWSVGRGGRSPFSGVEGELGVGVADFGSAHTLLERVTLGPLLTVTFGEGWLPDRIGLSSLQSSVSAVDVGVWRLALSPLLPLPIWGL